MFIRGFSPCSVVDIRFFLDMNRDFVYIPPMFTSAAVILLGTRKAAWHATAVAGGGFY